MLYFISLQVTVFRKVTPNVTRIYTTSNYAKNFPFHVPSK